MLKLITDLLSRWRSDPSPQWAARSPRQRAEVAYLWLLQSRAACAESHLYGLEIVPGQNAGQKKKPCLIVHCQTAEEIGPGSGADFFRGELQIHLQADYKKKRGAESFDQHRSALILGEVSALFADIARCKEMMNDAFLDERPFSHFHLVRHLEGQSIGVPVGGSTQQDTIHLEAWFHTFDSPAADPISWESDHAFAWEDETVMPWG